MSILSWFTRRRLHLDEQDFSAEVRSHLAMAEADRMAEGADARDARDAALKDFGNLALTTEAARRVWAPRWLEAAHDLASDARYAVRTLASQPAFALTVVGVLALGIGLNAAAFTMLKGIALSPVAGVDQSARLTVVYAETSAGRALRVSYPDYQSLHDHDDAFTDLFGSTLIVGYLGRGRSARQVSGELVTGNYFQALGVRAQQGRTLLPSDEVAPGRHPVVVLSDGVWRRAFDADPAVVGRTVEINHYPLTVVGVAEPSFHGTIFSYDIEVFVPVMMAAELGVTGGLAGEPAAVLTDRRAAVLFPHGFLRPGTSLPDASARTDAAWTALAADRPHADAAAVRLRVVPFWQSPTGGQTYMFPTVVVLVAMGLLVLMIACANLAGLVLVRGISRRGEIAVRLALGATRRRIIRLLLLENLVLAVPGAVLGVGLAWRGIPVLIGYADWLAAPQRLFFNVQVDGFVIGFAAAVACLAALVVGLAPALRSSRVDLVSAINADLSPRAARGRLRGGLVVTQVAVSVLLLVGAGLAARSVAAARQADPGFDPSHVAMVALDVTQAGYDEARGRAFYRALLDAARSEAGIESASLAAENPLSIIGARAQTVTVEGVETRRNDDRAIMSNTVSPGYFRTLRIRLQAGRPFEDRDDASGAPVVIVNTTFARRFWGTPANALGKRIRVGERGDWRTIIGVAADVKYLQINEAPRPYLYLPMFQAYQPGMLLYTRGISASAGSGIPGAATAAPASDDALVDQARALVERLDGDLPMPLARPLAERTKAAFIFLDLTATMLLVFGVAGMALAALGTYGLVSYAVKQSTHEIGLRMALGASGAAVVRGFLLRGLRIGAIGAALGVAAAFAAGGLLRSVLYGVSATDAVSFGQALAVVLGVVVLATLVPAWRASRIDPVRALRHQ